MGQKPDSRSPAEQLGRGEGGKGGLIPSRGSSPTRGPQPSSSAGVKAVREGSFQKEERLQDEAFRRLSETGKRREKPHTRSHRRRNTRADPSKCWSPFDRCPGGQRVGSSARRGRGASR